jgi:hypothetical protein
MEWVSAQNTTWGASAGNIVYSNHIYHTAGATIPQNLYSYDDVKNYLLNQRSYSQVVGKYPLWIGEIGAWVASGDLETQWFNNTLHVLNDWGVGYASWEWDQPGTGWQLQDNAYRAPFPPNANGQVLIQAIADGHA